MQLNSCHFKISHGVPRFMQTVVIIMFYSMIVMTLPFSGFTHHHTVLQPHLMLTHNSSCNALQPYKLANGITSDLASTSLRLNAMHSMDLLPSGELTPIIPLRPMGCKITRLWSKIHVALVVCNTCPVLNL